MKSSGIPSEQALRDIQHFGEEGGVVPVIDVAAISTFLDPSDMERTFQGELQGCYLYSRHSNPTVNIFGKKLAAMEGAEAALGVASGMAAIACMIDQIFRDTAPDRAAAGSLFPSTLTELKVPIREQALEFIRAVGAPPNQGASHELVSCLNLYDIPVWAIDESGPILGSL